MDNYRLILAYTYKNNIKQIFTDFYQLIQLKTIQNSKKVHKSCTFLLFHLLNLIDFTILEGIIGIVFINPQKMENSLLIKTIQSIYRIWQEFDGHCHSH